MLIKKKYNKFCIFMVGNDSAFNVQSSVTFYRKLGLRNYIIQCVLMKYQHRMILYTIISELKAMMGYWHWL